MNLEKLSTILKSEPKYRFQQVNKFLFSGFISSWQEASSLPQELRKNLEETCPLAINSQVFFEKQNKNSQKAIITLLDNIKIETVLIKQKSSKEQKERYTICLSTQVGCPLACTFCASGQDFKRNLTAAEIIEQAVFWGRFLRGKGKIDNVVFMGMGEPFLNYQEFIKAAKFLNNPETFNLGARRLSVSTIGIVPQIRNLAKEKMQINLAISLHASNDAKRSKLMPKAASYKISAILKAVDYYIQKTGRRVMFEYIMLKGINDSEKEAQELLKILNKPLYFLNLIPYNDTGRFQASNSEQINHFKDILERGGIPTTIRSSFGSSIAAACGQLQQQYKNNQQK